VAGSRDLTTLATVKAYLGITDSNSDTLLTRLITSCSTALVDEMSREVIRQSYTETIDGDDERIRRTMTRMTRTVEDQALTFSIELLHTPVIGDPTITIDGAAVTKRPDLNSDGWVLLEYERIEIVGSLGLIFTTGVANVVISYEAGEFIPPTAGSWGGPEAATVPGTPYQVTAGQPFGRFLSSVSVTRQSDGTALTKVASGPTAGQYSVDANGLYTFAAADTGLAVYLSYAYVPSDIEDCAVEMVAFKFRKRDRLDQTSANIGGQSVNFSREAWPITVQQTIDRWRVPPL
jgi:hypothetical protein